MGAHQATWNDAYYNQITTSEDVALDFLREKNLLLSLQNPPGKVILCENPLISLIQRSAKILGKPIS